MASDSKKGFSLRGVFRAVSDFTTNHPYLFANGLALATIPAFTGYLFYKTNLTASAVFPFSSVGAVAAITGLSMAWMTFVAFSLQMQTKEANRKAAAEYEYRRKTEGIQQDLPFNNRPQ